MVQKRILGHLAKTLFPEHVDIKGKKLFHGWKEFVTVRRGDRDQRSTGKVGRTGDFFLQKNPALLILLSDIESLKREKNHILNLDKYLKL